MKMKTNLHINLHSAMKTTTQCRRSLICRRKRGRRRMRSCRCNCACARRRNVTTNRSMRIHARTHCNSSTRDTAHIQPNSHASTPQCGHSHAPTAPQHQIHQQVPAGAAGSSVPRTTSVVGSSAGCYLAPRINNRGPNNDRRGLHSCLAHDGGCNR